MDIAFLGATGTVTGSKYLVSAGGKMILVDCGLFQGYKQLRLRNRAPLPVDVADIDAVILTHAHLDHSGYLPLLIKNGFAGKVYCSEATRDLCTILLPDSGHLQEEEAEYANRHKFSRHAPALPLYTRADAERSLARFAPVDFARDVELDGGLTLHLSPAGHMAEILGWLEHFESPPRQTFVTHGEPKAADALRHRIEENLGWRTCVPEYLETMLLESAKPTAHSTRGAS